MGNPTVTPIAETLHNWGFMVSEEPGHRSREQGILLAGVKVFAGTLIGIVTAALSAAAGTVGTNTGNGTIGTITVQAAPASQIGTYTLLLTAPTTFIVTAPDGATSTGTTGVAFSALGIGFTLAAGGTAFVAGDSFTFTITQTQGNPTITSAPTAGNTGNGTLSSVTAAGYAATVGIYTIEFNDATHFVVNAPNGQLVGHGTTGSVFKAGGLSFTITAGGTAFVPADVLTITVAPGSAKLRPWDPANVDGTQIVAGVLGATKDATNADKPAAYAARACEVNTSELLYPTGASAAVIAQGLAGLRSLGIIPR